MQGNYRLTIIFKEALTKKINVADLNPGDVMKWDGDLYMRTTGPLNKTGEFVRLADGELSWFGGVFNEFVPVKCSLREE